MSLSIRRVRTVAEYAACEESQIEAWRMADAREVVPLHMLVAAQDSGGLVLGAFDGDEMVGFVFGIAALSDSGRPQHYSHLLAVRPTHRDRGIDWQLKVAQREAVLAQGLDCILWTYDPLESRNAYLNVARLGVICRTYKRDLVDHAELQRRLRTPICLDESVPSLAAARAALALGSGRIVNIKPGRVGGLTVARAIHDLCYAHDLPVWCGGMLETGIGRAHNVALASLPGFTLPGDISASARYFHQDLVDPPFELNDDGTMTVPAGAGIGVDVVLARLEAATRRRATISPP